jgi:dTDP-L-rhamnose 4-epimerase
VSQQILITGGAGFIGTRVAARLLAQGDDVILADSFHSQVHTLTHQAGIPADATVLRFDVTDRPSWDALLRRYRPQVVIHLAAETGTGQSLAEATRHSLTNVVGTTQMTDALLASDTAPEHIVLASSRAVYGDGEWTDALGRFAPLPRTHGELLAGRWDPSRPDGGPASPVASTAADTAPRPSNVYAATKLAQEHVLGAWCAATGTALSVLRLQNVYGPGQSLGNSYAGVLTLFARLAAARQQIEVYEDGMMLRDFVFIEDVATAITTAVGRPPAAGRRTVDIGSGQADTLLAVAGRITALNDAPEPVISGRFRDGDVRAAFCSIDAARADLGYEPAWSLDRGLPALLDWAAKA